MNLSRNQKRYAWILGARAVALVVDRVFLAPGEAEADEPKRQPTIAVPTAIAPPERAPAPPRPNKPLADRFAKLAEEHGLDPAAVSDAFAVPWMVRDPGPEADPEELAHPELDAFSAAHRLNAVMELGGVKHAIVDGRRIGIGQIIDEFALREIRGRSVVFESPRFRRVELKLLDAGGQDGTPE